MTAYQERFHEVAASFRTIAEVRAAGGYAPIYQQMAAGASADLELLASPPPRDRDRTRQACYWPPPNSY